MISTAYAQQAANEAQPNPIMGFVPFILVFAVFYFLMIRPQKKRVVEERGFLNSLKKGDKIYTKSGILGTIIGLTEKVVDLEIAQGVKIKILRSQISGLSKDLTLSSAVARPK